MGNVVLSDFYFSLFLIVILLVSAAGYLINDIYDRQIDAINNGARVLIDKSPSVIRQTKVVYYFLNILSIFISMFICLRLDKLNIFTIVASAILFLWLYAIRLKKILIVGNFVIALLSALSIISVAMFEQEVKVILAAYVLAGFAFLTTLLREFIKDVEDIEGDRRFGVISLPIVIGVEKSKYYGYALLLCILVPLCYITKILWTKQFLWAVSFNFFVLIIPYLFIAFLLMKAKSKDDYSQLSWYNKVLMVLGILSLSLIYFI